MKFSLSQLPFLFALAIFLVPACTVTVDDDDQNPDLSVVLNDMDTFGWVYSEIVFEGSGLDANCSNVQVSLTNGTNSQNLEIQDCTAGAITAWIPEDLAPDNYDVTLNVDGNTFTELNDEALTVEVKLRPVILTMSTTEIAPEGTLTLTGLYLNNDTGQAPFDPQVWLMKPNYTNTVSEITVNDAGTEATVTIDDDPEPGEYNFLITCQEWSNEIKLTIL